VEGTTTKEKQASDEWNPAGKHVVFKEKADRLFSEHFRSLNRVPVGAALPHEPIRADQEQKLRELLSIKMP
jgi:hypothetical protein